MSRDSRQPDEARELRKRGRVHRKPTTRRLLWAVAGLAVALMAYLLTPRPDDDSRRVVSGDAFAKVRLTDFDGRPFALAEYHGTPVVLNFWASWCPPCAAEMPDFEKVHVDLRGEVAFVGVNQRDERGAAQKLARTTGVTYRLVEDPDGRLFDAFGSAGMPTTVFIHANGDPSRIVPGQLSEEQLRTHIAALTRASPPAIVGGNGENDPAPLIDPSEIRQIVARDAIPALDEPRFVSVSEVDWLAAREPVIAISIKGDVRAYPLQILTWHEIVNDVVGGHSVIVTFCPLCNTAIAFERPIIAGEATTFGTSGALYNSNLVMYDRATESYWPQATGEAVTGPLTGQRLERVPAQIVSWSDFRASFPEGRVLSRDTGHSRSYGTNPYPGYDDVDTPPFLFEGEVDGRLAAVERVLGLQVGDEVVAFPYFRLREAAAGGVAAVNARIGRLPVLVVWKSGVISALDEGEIATSRDVGSAAAFVAEIDGRELRFEVRAGHIEDEQTSSVWDIFGRALSGPLKGRQLRSADAFDTFWFDWAAFHPDTLVWPQQ